MYLYILRILKISINFIMSKVQNDFISKTLCDDMSHQNVECLVDQTPQSFPLW